MRPVIVAPAVLVVLVAGIVLLLRDQPRSATAYPVPGEDGPHIEVEVLNGTRVDGLARETTRLLRRRGIDVVYFGSGAGPDRDSTELVVRRGDSTTAIRVREILRVGRVVYDPDPRLSVDVSVLLGHDAAAIDFRP